MIQSILRFTVKFLSPGELDTRLLAITALFAVLCAAHLAGLL